MTGWLVAPGDDDAYCRRLGEILVDPTAACGLRQAALAAAEARVSPQAVAGSLRRCFEEIGMAPRPDVD